MFPKGGGGGVEMRLSSDNVANDNNTDATVDDVFAFVFDGFSR
jgi:hypothetical protein